MTLIVAIIILVIILLFVIPKFFRKSEQFDSNIRDFISPIFSYGYLPTYFTYNDDESYYNKEIPTLYLYNNRRHQLYTPTRWNRLNYYYYAPYGLRKDFHI